MSISENLQILRKSKNMSQEELAEKLNVSRQAVSKWESGSGYPETEKIISICEIFDCSMDELVKGKIADDIKVEKNNYDSVMTSTAKGIAIAVGIIILGTAAMMTIMGVLNGQEQSHLLGVIAVLVAVVFAVPMLIVFGTKNDNFIKKNPKVANVYTEEEIEKGNSKYTIVLACGISTILLGVIAMFVLMGLKVFGEESTLPVAVLLYFVAIGVTTLIYGGKMKEKFDIETYNKQNTDEAKAESDKVGKVCGVIMLIATAIFLALGFTLKWWHICWVVFPIGGILCGIVATILRKETK